MNQESLDRANALLAAFAERAEPGELSEISPTELGKEIGMTEPLAAARAVRALLARRRLEAVNGRYRLVDARPIEPGERESVPRARRAKKTGRRKVERRASGGGPTYNDLGREAVDRLIELGREVATLRAGLRSAREEAREAREARVDAERRARTLTERVREFEARAEMAEANLRTLLAAAKGSGRDVPVGHDEMEAILGVLKTGDGEEARSGPAEQDPS